MRPPPIKTFNPYPTRNMVEGRGASEFGRLGVEGRGPASQPLQLPAFRLGMSKFGEAQPLGGARIFLLGVGGLGQEVLG